MIVSVGVFLITVILLFLTICLAFLCINAMGSMPPCIILLDNEDNAEGLIRNALDNHPLSSIVVVDKNCSENARKIVRTLQKENPRILFLKELSE